MVGEPEKYTCGKCAASGCKLWRGYQDCPMEFVPLFCSNCACVVSKLDVADMDGNGGMPCVYYAGTMQEYEGRAHKVGALVPAIPKEDMTAYCAHEQVSDDGQVWWSSLPTRPVS